VTGVGEADSCDEGLGLDPKEPEPEPQAGANMINAVATAREQRIGNSRILLQHPDKLRNGLGWLVVTFDRRAQTDGTGRAY